MGAPVLDPAAIRAYVARDWKRARLAKVHYWRERLDRGGLAESLRVTDELRRAMKQVSPSWPTEKEREEDLETHRRVAQAFTKTANRSQ